LHVILNDNDIALGSNENVFLASPTIKVTAGVAASNAIGTSRNRDTLIQEFLYANIQIPTAVQYKEDEIAIFLAIRAAENKPWTLLSLPGDVNIKGRRILLRLNVWGLLEQLSSAEEPKLRLFLSGWNSA
jgi:hypothetical protein